jgi:lysozyme family protein
MVISRSKHTRKPRVPQASPERPFQPNKINANTTFDFEGHAESRIMPTLYRMRRQEGLGPCCESA